MGLIVRLSAIVLFLVASPAFGQNSTRAVKQAASANSSKSLFVYTAQFNLLRGESQLFDLIPRGVVLTDIVLVGHPPLRLFLIGEQSEIGAIGGFPLYSNVLGGEQQHLLSLQSGLLSRGHLKGQIYCEDPGGQPDRICTGSILMTGYRQ